MKLILDTNAYSNMMRRHENVVRVIGSATQIYLPAPVVGELFFGFQMWNRSQQNHQQLQQFLDHPLVEFSATDELVCNRYALILSQLKKKGQPIPTNDIWIAAHALTLGADLLSSDDHFSCIDGLSWLKP